MHPRVAGVGDGTRRHHKDSRRGTFDPVPLSSEATDLLFEGDIVPDYESIIQAYGPTVAQELEEKGLIVKGNSTLRQADVNKRWNTRVNGVVQIPYAFSGEHDANAVALIENAMKELADRSKVIKFVRRTSEADYIMIVEGPGCWSLLGKQGGQQPLNLQANGCVYRGTVQHEFLHALGFYHEQSRPDRDSFIKINYENIDPKDNYQFAKQTESKTLGSPYDYGSVMHYDKTAFSKNQKDTITAPQPIGLADAADEEDIRQVVLMYQCVSAARSLDQYLASPCSQDCQCWEGASGCKGDNNACFTGLVCNARDECALPGVVAPVVSPMATPVVAPVGFSPGGAPNVAPVGAPVESSPVGAPVGFSPVDTPISTPAAAPVELSPVGAPVVAPVGFPPVGTPIGTPVVSPVWFSPFGSPVRSSPTA